MEDYPLAYYEFFVKYNEGDYYTCHDLLEEMWLEERSNLFLKGLLQMVVAQYHYSYGNIKGARLMMEVAEQYLTPYCPLYWNLDVNEVVAFIQSCRKIIPEKVEKVPYEQVHDLPSLPELIIYMK
ncbi:DUF309 domain-containing protein [Bacillus pseudomycoides]|uniref:DUF309 domain-containing protein n=1 Tax=Bacillus pseudomycoides TaxID=64104 RepID=A0A2B6JU17_9BACI|nr:DUF309 domain-containing protein [Bacillus pseudomycoides]PDY45020.1 hypothetical protein CON79_22405 [Bacillus pseudomycoides]PEA80606.1 hypothetical protein CON99_27210 [Bacillus pseudomycoides]PED08545.1 hypothetical protein COO19_09550 [Bacillus pseudomycoides]PED69226.1 hypothetical protein CON97_26530 [Bacillus pseudomycoides]PEI37859.1 hypothetical protein CN620_22220 [Bacillus pseudomycoides]